MCRFLLRILFSFFGFWYIGLLIHGSFIFFEPFFSVNSISFSVDFCFNIFGCMFYVVNEFCILYIICCICNFVFCLNLLFLKMIYNFLYRKFLNSTNYSNLKSQEVFGNLVIPKDSLNPNKK